MENWPDDFPDPEDMPEPEDPLRIAIDSMAMGAFLKAEALWFMQVKDRSEEDAKELAQQRLEEALPDDYPFTFRFGDW